MKTERTSAPPGWAIRFIRWFCPEDLQEGIIGDLLEEFDQDVADRSLRLARWRFTWSALRFFHPSIIARKKFEKVKIMNLGMFKSHVNGALRGIAKHKFYSLINIFGLAMAIAFVFLSYLHVESQLAYDQFHENKEAVYRIYHQVEEKESGEITRRMAILPIPLTEELSRQVPSVEFFTRVASTSAIVKKLNTPYQELISFVDEDFFSLFSFPMIQGDVNTALLDRNSIVISRQKAEKFFGKDNPVGRPLEMILNDSLMTFIVSGIFENRQSQSSLSLDFLIPFENYELVVSTEIMKSYRHAMVEGYVRMSDPDVVEGISPILSSAIADEMARDGYLVQLGTQPLESIHFDTEITGNASYVNPLNLYIISGLAILVFIVSIINFITLTTGHSMKRLKEVGLRKTFGAIKVQIGSQLLVESCIVSLIATILGALLAMLLLPHFNSLIGAGYEFSLNYISILFLMALIMIVAFACTIVQLILLVRFNPADAIRGSNLAGKKKSGLNDSLVVLQFAISIALIIGTLIIRSQLNYIQTKEVGYVKEQLLEIEMNVQDPGAAKQLLDRFRTQVEMNPRVVNISAAMNSFREPWTRFDIAQQEGEPELVFYNKVDEHYIRTMGIELIEGVDFDDESSSLDKILVNESLVEHFGWTDPLSQQIPGKNFESNHQIIGIFKDFHFSTLHLPIEPLAISVDKDAIIEGVTGLSTHVWPINLYTIVVRLDPRDIHQTIDFLESEWKEVNKDQPFNYYFVDQVLADQYAEEQRWQKIIDAASVFAILIAWLGLIGLTRLSFQRRIKEVGIRKVLGSSTTRIMGLLTRKSLILVLIANLVALPIAWWLSAQWLESFVYRVGINPLLFATGGVAVLLVAIGSVIIQTVRVARANPVDALRYE